MSGNRTLIPGVIKLWGFNGGQATILINK